MSGASGDPNKAPSGSYKRKRVKAKEAEVASLPKITKWCTKVKVTKVADTSATTGGPATTGPLTGKVTEIDSAESCQTASVSTPFNSYNILHTYKIYYRLLTRMIMSRIRLHYCCQQLIMMLKLLLI
jgi:hypothetical protein